MSQKKQGLRNKWIAASRRLRELGMIAHGLLDANHVVMAHIIPMRRCNLACAYCNEYDAVSKPVPLDTMLQRIDQLARLGTAIVTISGGEPILHPELDDIIRHIRNHGMIAGMITNGYLLTAERIERLNRAGLDHMQISIDNVMPDDVSKKSLKVLDKKLQLLSEHAEFHVNINSVVGGGIHNPHDALVVGRRARQLGFTSTVGIIHDGDGQLRPLSGEERTVFFKMHNMDRAKLLAFQLVPGQHRQRQTERLALPGRRTLHLYLRGRTGALLLAAARLSRRAADAIHEGGCSARVFDHEELRSELHRKLCSPGELYRLLARAANVATAVAPGRGRRTDPDPKRLTTQTLHDPNTFVTIKKVLSQSVPQ